MTDNWFIQDVERLLTHRNRVVIIDPLEKCGFLVSLLDKKEITVLKTDGDLTENWQQVKEELLLRYEAETEHKEKPVVFYVTRQQDKLSFLFDYCFTHGCLDLSNPIEWLKKKIFTHTGLQVQQESGRLWVYAKLGIGKDIAWWKKVIPDIDKPLEISEELLLFLDEPEAYLKGKEADVRRYFEELVFELLGQPYMAKPAKTLAEEVAKRLFDGLIHNDVSPILLQLYYRWADSATYRPSLENYIHNYDLTGVINPWKAHPDHCFKQLDNIALRQLTKNLRDEGYVTEKLSKIKTRVNSGKTKSFVPSWWQNVLTLMEFDSKPLSSCSSFDAVIDFYTKQFAPVDRAIRYLYMNFLPEKEIIRPLQEHYESLNHELLGSWFNYSPAYKTDQQGYLVNLIKTAKPKIAVIVGDGISYEIANYVASELKPKFNVDTQVMLADMPSETEHNMSAMYVGNNEVLATKKERETRLSSLTGKEIVYLDLEALNRTVEGDFLVLSYKDIDDVGEKLQHRAIKLFAEMENVLKAKIALLLNMGYREVHLVTDHGFVLTGLLDESDKIEASAVGKKDVKERYFRAAEKQSNTNLFEFARPYGEYNYVYAAKSHRPFKSKGVYGFAHGGFTPQEIIIPKFTFSKVKSSLSGLKIEISNKKDLGEVTGEQFAVKLTAESTAADLFSTQRKVQILLYAGGANYQSSSLITIKPGEVQSLDFSFDKHKEVEAVLIDADTKEQIDKVMIKQTNLRDLGGLL